MIFEGVCYPVIHFYKVILLIYVWSSLRSQSFLGKYLVEFTSTFVFGRISMPFVSPLHASLLLMIYVIISLFPRLSALPSGKGVQDKNKILVNVLFGCQSQATNLDLP